ncbi:flagellar hook protein FliD [Burkholderia sp. Bp9090]|uniref:flagellar filament capping protein FliD n=1 Tax=Burkholderia sp. Bp9090 TaxID=2184567 RepID=UPI000F5E5B57|nr:flagellar filament capping protein FliD [Burkholderia sp. Bp9090]RQZ32279.1 flagellar hook protein FliD [Burkholderia sp. Bp9090]
MSTTNISSTTANSALTQAAQSIISGVTNSNTDTSALVSAMVTAKMAAQTTQNVNRQNLDNTTLSAIGSLKSALSSLQSALSGLTDGSALAKTTATASGSGLSATTSTGSVAGSYSIAVTQVATAQKLALTAGVQPSTKQLGTGSLTITLGSGAPMTVGINTGNNTLAGIASAINSASGNPGVTATVVTGTDGSHLVLTSNVTGAANTIQVSTNSTDGLASLATVDSSGVATNNYVEKNNAQDAMLSIDGITNIQSASNTITGAITGVTLNLATSAANTTQTLTVAADNTSATNAINGFVSAYNSFVSTASSLSSFDSTAAAGSQGGPLIGDSMLNSIVGSLATALSKGVTSGSSTVSLSALGINLTPSGTLSVDSAALSNALTHNSASVATAFNATNGIGAVLNNNITSYLQTGGIIDTRVNALNSDLADAKTQAKTLQAYANQLTDQYNAQFTALNTLMARMQNNSQYLTQLFGGTNSAGALATNKS